MKKQTTLILGGGGREHAMEIALASSDAIGDIFCAPGNVGMKNAVPCQCDITDGRAVVDLCEKIGATLVVCGPEAPLAAGVGDAIRARGIGFFGPGREGAQLESSKIFSKLFMKRHGIPTAKFDICTSQAECDDAISRREAPFVIKADGLAAGKGVVIADDPQSARNACAEMLSGKILAGAGSSIVIEDHTKGLELSVFAITDGNRCCVLPPSRDHKRAFSGDKGPNTGGMGAFSPVTIPNGFLDRVRDKVLDPTIAGLRAEGIDYRGVIYMGLMICEDGEPSVIEYNARFGDPEAQVVIPTWRGDLGAAMLTASHGALEDTSEHGAPTHALGVVIASGGYPGDFKKGCEITGLDAEVEGSMIIHAGTKRGEEGRVVTAGGRVLTAVGTGSSFAEARSRAYSLVDKISFQDMMYRKDIGWSEEK